MAGWGTIDLLAARLSRKVGFLLSGVLVQCGAFALTALLAPALLVVPATINWLGLAVLGVTGVLVYLLFYRALTIGAVSIVAPITGSWGMITALLGIVFLHETATPVRLASIVLVTAGIVAISLDWVAVRRLARTQLLPGAGAALVAALGWGVTYLWLGPLNREMGWYFTTLGTRAFGMLAFIPIVLLRPALARSVSASCLHPRRGPKGTRAGVPWVMVLGIIVVDVIAFTTYNFAVTRYEISLVSIVASASPLVSVALAHLTLGERLNRPQLAGVVLVLVGLAGLNVKG
jgi:drug/metabolite transporter (DMT)-like permease